MTAYADYFAARTAVTDAIASVRALQTTAGDPIDATNALEVQTLAEANSALVAAQESLTGDQGMRAYEKLVELGV
jgi:hypothetical protein